MISENKRNSVKRNGILPLTNSKQMSSDSFISSDSDISNTQLLTDDVESPETESPIKLSKPRSLSNTTTKSCDTANLISIKTPSLHQLLSRNIFGVNLYY
ncbi:hypothetical protein QTP88_006951 [Uroleucon formosanum]